MNTMLASSPESEPTELVKTRAPWSHLKLLAVAGLFAACSSLNAPVVETSVWALVSVNGQTVPYDEGPEPPRPNVSTPCNSLLTRGQLSLVSETSTFEFWYEHGSTCTDRVLGRSGATGTYRVSGGNLELKASIGPGEFETYRAVVRGGTIDLPSRFYHLKFSRS